MAGELSNSARELLVRERDLPEDEALKARAMTRARAASERPSGIGLRQAPAAALHSGSRRVLRALPLIAAGLAMAGFAIAGASTYADQTRDQVTSLRLTKVRVVRARPLAVGGGLLDSAPSSSGAREQAPVPRAVVPAPAAGESTRPPNLKQYSAELALLEPARNSIGRGDYSAALGAIAQHRREFPNGQLSEEREALRVRALWGLGQRPAALAAAQVFRRRYPRSGLLSWLKAQSDQTP